MLIKAGVDISRLRPEIRKALNEINNIYRDFEEELVITSTYEGNHSPGSKHYANDAVDIRKPLKHSLEALSRLRNILDVSFFILMEKTHIHIHYLRM